MPRATPRKAESCSLSVSFSLFVNVAHVLSKATQQGDDPTRISVRPSLGDAASQPRLPGGAWRSLRRRSAPMVPARPPKRFTKRGPPLHELPRVLARPATTTQTRHEGAARFAPLHSPSRSPFVRHFRALPERRCRCPPRTGASRTSSWPRTWTSPSCTPSVRCSALPAAAPPHARRGRRREVLRWPQDRAALQVRTRGARQPRRAALAGERGGGGPLDHWTPRN